MTCNNPGMTTTQRVFDADLLRLCQALAPFVLTADDGFRYVSPDAPAGLASAYQELCAYGYANSLL